jgi:hypothetical protein
MGKSVITAVLAAALLCESTPAAVRGDHAAYIGGTAAIRAGMQGTLSVSSTTDLVFSGDKGSGLKIPYVQITELEFGQKVGRRVGATIALGVTTLGVCPRNRFALSGVSCRSFGV